MGAPQFKVIAAVLDRDVETLFDLAQMAVQLPAESCQITCIVRFEGEGDM
jgi:hypothetical protein